MSVALKSNSTVLCMFYVNEVEISNEELHNLLDKGTIYHNQILPKAG